MKMSTTTITALATGLAAVVAGIFAAVQSDAEGGALLGAIAAPVLAFLGGLFADLRDDGKINGSVDYDARGYALTDALGALALAGVLSWALLACGTMSSVVQAETTQAEIRADVCGSAHYDFREGSGMWALGGYLDADAGGVIKVARFLAVPVKTRLRLDGGTGDDVSEARALWCVSVFGIESCPLDAQAER